MIEVIIGILIGIVVGIILIHGVGKITEKVYSKNNFDEADVKSFIMMSYIFFISALTIGTFNNVLNLPEELTKAVINISIIMTIIWGWVGIVIDHINHKSKLYKKVKQNKRHKL